MKAKWVTNKALHSPPLSSRQNHPWTISITDPIIWWTYCHAHTSFAGQAQNTQIKILVQPSGKVGLYTSKYTETPDARRTTLMRPTLSHIFFWSLSFHIFSSMNLQQKIIFFQNHLCLKQPNTEWGPEHLRRIYKGVNLHSTHVTLKQRPHLPSVTFTSHASK